MIAVILPLWAGFLEVFQESALAIGLCLLERKTLMAISLKCSLSFVGIIFLVTPLILQIERDDRFDLLITAYPIANCPFLLSPLDSE